MAGALARGHEVIFATESGAAAPKADPRVLQGVLFGKMGAPAACRGRLRRDGADRGLQEPARRVGQPRRDDVRRARAPGRARAGHARAYLESETLRAQVRAFWKLERPVGAICHGVLVLARTRDFATGKSVIATRRTTCLTKAMELVAYYTTFNGGLGRYYRTYDQTVQDEVQEALVNPGDAVRKGPFLPGGPRHPPGCLSTTSGPTRACLRGAGRALPVRPVAR